MSEKEVPVTKSPC